VRLIHVTLADPVYRAGRAHTSSPSFSSHFPVVAPSNQSFSLLFTHLLQLFVPANSSSKLCLLIDKIILYYCNYCLCFHLASSYLGINIPADSECTDYKNCDKWRDETDQDEIGHLLTERNRAHFGQSGNANLCQPPLEILMDFEGSCAKADKILQGEFAEEGLTPATKWVLEQMKYVAHPDSIPWELKVEEYEGKIKSWKETTSTSPMTGGFT